MELVLSLFPGIDLLGRAFTDRGFCVLPGPDLLWDEMIEDFHVPAGKFDGVIGGPPCQNYSDANRHRDTAEGDRLVLEFLRLIDASRPQWFLMENVRNVPDVAISGYTVQRIPLENLDCGGNQRRLRHVQFGHVAGHVIRPRRTSNTRPVTPIPTVTTKRKSRNDRHSRRSAAQGLSTPLSLRSLTPAARDRVIGNAVPWTMGTTLADAVHERGPVTLAAIEGSHSAATSHVEARAVVARHSHAAGTVTPSTGKVFRVTD